MNYLINTDPEDVTDEEILRSVDLRVKVSDKEILDSIHGYRFTGVMRQKLCALSLCLDGVNNAITYADEVLAVLIRKYVPIIRYLTTMVGITERSALYILGEIGTDMSVWRDDAALCSWAGLAPANNSSAGKKKSTRTGDGDHYLKPLLAQCALAAVKSTKRDPYYRIKYERLKKRR